MLNFNEKKYDNLSKAVAFEISFESFIYSYGDLSCAYFEKELCSHCHNNTQHVDFLAPKVNCKKDFGILDILKFGVSANIRSLLIENFDITEEDFRPVRTKSGEIVFYQITPQHTMLPISDVNRIKQLKPCSKCGAIQYRDRVYENKKGEPYHYISKKALEDLHDINVTYEKFEMFTPYFVVSKRVYDFLIERYPRLHFMPFFLKD